MDRFKIIIAIYFVAIFGLFLYSYTQVDLSLTLSRASIFQTVEKSFQYIGYFNRPLSTYLFSGILAVLFIFYGLFLAFSKKISVHLFWKILFPVTILLAVTYNAFSYDLFNYIFYTKIILHYHQNPYLVTALDFPKDPMLSFMHWTHNTYPYGPFWLVLTVPLGLIGLNYFLPTFFFFKFFAAICFVGTVFFIGKIMEQISPKDKVSAMVLYALNPLILIESLVSAHNDVAMVFLAVMGMYLLIKKKLLFGLVAVILAALTKQAMIFLLLPAFIYAGAIFLKKSFISEKMFLLSCFFMMLIGFCVVISKIEIQPWYTMWFLPFFVVFKPRSILLWLMSGFCFGVLLRYVPYLWQGDWNGMATMVKLYVTIITPIVFLLVGSLWSFIQMRYAKK